ncbi:MAG: type II secretion system protein J [Opitutales bacterium]
MNRINQRRTRRGFTLVELMTATGIMVGLMSMVFLITQYTLSAWDKAAGKLSTNQEARVAFDLLSRDMESALFQSDDRVWMEIAFDVEAGVGNIELPPPPQIMLFAPVGDLGTQYPPGSVAAVKYSVVHRSVFDPSIFATAGGSDGQQRIYGLYRAVIDPRATFFGPLNRAQNLGTPAVYWNRESLPAELQFLRQGASALAPSGNVRDFASDFSNFLAGNIADVRLTLGGMTPSQGLVDSDGRLKLDSVRINTLRGDGLAGGQVSLRFGEALFTGNDPSTGLISEDLPTYIDVTMTVVTPEGAAEIKTLANAATGEIDSAKFQEILVKKGTTFTRRVFLQTSDS